MGFTPIRYVQCEVCRDRSGPQDQPGFYFVESDTKGATAVVECDCHKKWVHTNKILVEAYKNNIWVDADSLRYNLQSYRGTSSSVTLTKIQRYIDKFNQPDVQSLVLYIQGRAATQKTHIAHYIGLSLFRRGFKAFYTQMKLFNSFLCNPYTSDENEILDRHSYLSRIENSDCLIIDDAFDKNIAPVYSSGTQSPYIESYLRDRIEGNHKSVIFVSRVVPTDIKKNGYSESLQSFVSMNTSQKHTYMELQDVYNNFDIPSIFKDIE